jgi:hypothetical protein
MTTAHWVTGGGTVGFGAPNAVTNVDHAIPANATVKRFQVRQVNIQGYNAGVTNFYVQPLALRYVWSFTTGAYAGRELFRGSFAVPMQSTVFLATAISTYNVWYFGGDKEMGMNQRCSFGGAGKAASNLRFSWFVISAPGWPNSYSVGMNYQTAVLYDV